MRWSGSHSVGFPWGNPVFSHKNTTRTQTSVPTSLINVSDVICFVIVVKWIQVMVLVYVSIFAVRPPMHIPCRQCFPCSFGKAVHQCKVGKQCLPCNKVYFRNKRPYGETCLYMCEYWTTGSDGRLDWTI